MDTVKIAAISFSNYVIGLTQVHELLQVIVALLSIILLIMNIKKGK
jgi:hypothetical protein|tara:strand:+ start:1252 stop:1389 length:138 start_codon:yes stop_codon:yes gene_type:complete